MIDKVAVIGLGLMGSAMSSRLIDHGFTVRGYDPDVERVAEFEEGGGFAATSPADAVRGCWSVLLSLPTSNVSGQVCFGEQGILSSGVTPLIVYDTTTGRAVDARRLAAALEGHGVTYCDTTLSGNSALARQGDLVVMMGGPHHAFDQGRSIFAAIGRASHHVGGVGTGFTMKLLVNHVLTIHRLALAEGLVVAELADLDLEATLGVLRDSLAYSKAMDVWGERMVEGNHTEPASRLRQGLKDVRLIVEHAHEVGASAELASVVMSTLNEGEQDNLAEMDNSAVIEVLRRRSDIGRV